MRNYKNTRNPILPPDIHIPDSEAHVMPDGKLYLYGSFDSYDQDYCSEKYHVVSTPDMENWTIYGEAMNGSQVPWSGDPDAVKYPGPDWRNPTPVMKGIMQEMREQLKEKLKSEGREDVCPEDAPVEHGSLVEHPHLLYAPDCISRNGKYYLYFCMSDDSEGVAVSDRPQGPFGQFKQLPCGGIDPAVFVDDDGQAYYYWGQFRSHGVKLNPDMVSFDPESIVDNLLTEEEHYFHEGSSVRKIGDTYYCVFADIERGKPTALGYATGKSPLGPFTYRGIIIDNEGCDPSTWNNHGSIECVNGRWYVFYHRSSRNSRLHRRLCIEPIVIGEGGTIAEVKMTSQGPGAPFGPGEKIMGYQACGLKGSLYIDQAGQGAGQGDACGQACHEGGIHEEGCPGRVSCEEEVCDAGEKLTHIMPGDEAVFRYIESAQEIRGVRVKAWGSGMIELFLDGEYAGSVTIRDGIVTASHMGGSAGLHQLTLRFRETQGLELLYLILD